MKTVQDYVRTELDQEAEEALIQRKWDQFVTMNRACDPRPGDRFVGLDNTTVIEVKSVFLMEDAGRGPGHDRCVEYTDSRHGQHLFNLFIWKFQELATTAIQAGHTFHAVEDDEE